MSAYWKIPLQAMILLLGVLVFLYYTFQPTPLYFNPTHDQVMRASAPATYDSLAARYTVVTRARADAALTAVAARQSGNAVATTAALDAYVAKEQEAGRVRTAALAAVGKVTGAPTRDVNYVIPRFVLDNLPLGFAGIFLAAVLAAAMSSIAAELNSLSTATVVDFYQRHYRREGSDAHFLAVSKWATAIWGVFACVVATYAATLGSLIEVVNRFGSYFYGSILGVFILAMIPGARPLGAFVGLIAGMLTVGLISWQVPSIAFLWHNVTGAVTVVTVGLLLSMGPAPKSA